MNRIQSKTPIFVIPLLLLLVVLLFGAMTSCEKPDENQEDVRKTIIEETWNGFLSPKLKELEKRAKVLHEKSKEYCSGTTPNPQKLKEVQNAWLETFKILKQEEIFSFGPARDSLLERRRLLNDWPSNIGNINSYIKTGTDFSPSFFSKNFMTTRAGLPAIEYLIYERKPEPNNTDNSCKYLLGTSEAVVLVVEDLYKSWSPEATGGYFKRALNPSAVDQDGNPDYLKPASQIANSMWHMMMEIRQTYLNKAVLLIPSAHGQKIMAKYSGEGVVGCKEALKGIKELYVGSPDAKVSFSKLIALSNPELNTRILDNFTISENALNSLKNNALEKNSKADVQRVYDAMEPLLALLSTNLLQELGFVKFQNESDGD